LRRLAGALLGLALVSCGSSPPPKPAPPPGPKLHLSPTSDLAQAASIVWLLDVAPRELVAHADLLPAIDAVLPRAKVASFAERYGFDPLALEELTWASYGSEVGDTMLYVARGAFDPGKLEALFRARAGGVDGRGVDREGEQAIVRTWGTVRGERAQLATFGHEGAALEVGRFGPLRVAELFAQERLKRASPALRAGSLARAAELVGDAPLRGFALGPFEGENGKWLGGLLAACTAAAASARPDTLGDRAALRLTLVLTGGWGDDGERAADRLAAAFDALGATSLGRLSGLDHALSLAKVERFPDALRLTVALDAMGLARGAAAAMGAEVAEIMSY
jgi:hypothetical protein